MQVKRLTIFTKQTIELKIVNFLTAQVLLKSEHGGNRENFCSYQKVNFTKFDCNYYTLEISVKLKSFYGWASRRLLWLQ